MAAIDEIVRKQQEGVDGKYYFAAQDTKVKRGTPTNNAREAYRLLIDIYNDNKVFLGTELRVRVAEFIRDTPPVA